MRRTKDGYTLRTKSKKKLLLVAAACACAVLIGWIILLCRPQTLSFDPDHIDVLFDVRGGRVVRGASEDGVPLSLCGVRLSSEQADEQILKLIAGMNADTVFLELPADSRFYEALASFNRQSTSPLYLLQGTDGSDTSSNRKLIDRIHQYGLSEWVIGYVLDARGMENRSDAAGYRGTCVYTADGAGSAEVCLARCADELIRYESSVYGVQRLIVFAGHPEIDPIEHDLRVQNFGMDQNIDFEKIRLGTNAKSGLTALYFAKTDEAFFEFEPFYADYFDESGTANPYRAYLTELCAHHDMPVAVCYRGDDALSERKAAALLPARYEDAVSAGCALVLLHEWSDAAIREENICRVDGEMSDWEQAVPAAQADGMFVQVQCDSRYVYFRLYAEGFDSSSERLHVELDTLPFAGDTHGTDFVIVIEGSENSRLLTWSDGEFSVARSVIREEVLLENGRMSAARIAPVGELRMGNANPASADYDSEADFMIRRSGAEIRVERELLGLSASTRQHSIGVTLIWDGASSGEEIREIRRISGRVNPNESPSDKRLRLTSAYYALKEAFSRDIDEGE